jgi:hypothetical protein
VNGAAAWVAVIVVLALLYVLGTLLAAAWRKRND